MPASARRLQPPVAMAGPLQSQRRFVTLLAHVALCTLIAGTPDAHAMIAAPPGANVGDTPATFEGMAVAVDVGPDTGAATFEYPLPVPPGRNGLQPDLKLVYSHLTRDTEVGFGWELPLGRIERVTRRGVPRYDDAFDILQVTLPDRRFELVRVWNGWAARVDDVHVSVTVDPAGALRMVWPSGLVYTFGGTPESRIVRPGSAATFAWHLTRIADPNGNHVDIAYFANEGYAYPYLVSYGGNFGAGLPHAYNVALFWYLRTPDQHRVSCAAGFCRTLRLQLGRTGEAAILITGLTGGLVRRFDLVWQPSAVNGAPLLREIRVVGTGGEVLTKANGQPASTRFEYHEPGLVGWSGDFPAQLDWEAHDYAEPVIYDEFNDRKLPWRDWTPSDPCTDRDFVDLNGDGRPDWVRSGPNYDQQTNPNWIVRLNQGRGTDDLFGPEIAWPAPRKCLTRRVEAYWLYTDYSNFDAVNDALGSVPCDGTTDPAKKLRCSQITKDGLVDLNGDGRPEYVDTDQPAGQNYWKVWFPNPDRPGFQSGWVAWPVPTPPGSSAMNGRHYRLEFTETSVAGFEFDEPEIRYLVIGDEISVTLYETPTNRSWIQLRQRPVQALVDMNADGRPDLVDVGLGASVPGKPWVHNYGGENRGQVRVYWNLGTGFASEYEVLLGGPKAEPIRAGGASPSRFLRSSTTANSGRPEQNVGVEMFDLNGDGLRDVVKALGDARARAQCGAPWKWLVWFGTGTAYPSSHADLQPGEVPSFDGPHCWDSPHNEELREWNKKRTQVDVLDINADGLPDYVNATDFRGSTDPITICDEDCEPEYCEPDDPGCCCWTDWPYNPLWRVWINTGVGLQDRGYVFFPKSIRTNALETDTGTTIGVITETFDLDGNGYPDSVQTGEAGHLKINYRHPDNLLPNTLVRVTNPLGATTDIDYALTTEFDTPEVDPDVDPYRYHHHLPFPLAVVRSITRQDPWGGESGTVRTRWEYRGGYFDPIERRVVGFRSVDRIAVVPDPANPGRLKDGPHEYAEFHQSPGREGRKWLEYVFVEDGYNGLLKHREFRWRLETRDESTGWRRYFPTLTERLEVDGSSNPGPHWDSRYCPRLPGCPGVLPEGTFRARRETFAYDECGNLTVAITADATEAHRTNNPALDVKLRRVDTAFSTAGTCDASLRTCVGICDRVIVRQVEGGLREEFEYERGNQRLARRVGEGNPTTLRTFDDVGNLIEVVDARGMVTRIDYDSPRRLYPVTWIEDVGDATHANHTTRREYHPAFGLVSKHIDAAGAVTLYDYDAFGRLKAVAEPGQTLAAPTRRYSYVIDDTASRTRVEAEHREPGWTLGGAYRKEVTFYDGLGRRLRRQLHRTVDGVVRSVVLDAVEYDSSGQVVREFAPVAFDAWTVGLFVPLNSSPATQIVRDEFLREVRRILPDGSVRTTDLRTAWVAEECDAINASAPMSGLCIASEVDALGRPRRTDQYLGDALAPSRSEVREYWASGALKTVTVTAPGTGPPVVTSYGYDALVRMTAMDDPSSGLWTYGYDPNDNRILEDDPTAGRHIQTQYDALNRISLREEWDGGVVVHRTTFEYDGLIPFGTGRLLRVWQQPVEGFEHRLELTGYDARGNPTGTIQRIATSGAGNSRSYTTSRTYDAIGRIRTMTLPAPGGQETLLYGYAPAGEIVRVGSDRNAAYVTDVRYDERGRMTTLAYGNGVTDAFAYHTPDGRDSGGPSQPGHGDRLAHITSQHAGRGETLRRLDYTGYDANGRLTRVLDGLGGGVVHDAVYDDAGRLTNWSGSNGAVGSYEYDGLGRLTAKEGKGYTYSATRPFHIATYDGVAVSYDANGNLIELPAGRSFTYDARGNLVRATQGGGDTRYFYDDRGRRRAQIEPDGRRTYFFDDFDVVVGPETIRRYIRLGETLVAQSTVAGTGVLQTARATPADLRRLHGFTGAMAVVLVAIGFALPARGRFGSRRVSRRLPLSVAALLVTAQWPTRAWAQCTPGPFADTRLYYHMDHLASAHLLTNAAGERVESTTFFPYGAVADRRDAAGAPVMETQGAFAFAGHRTVETHGLTYFQARWYAPELAVFTSRDPAGQYPNPYSYADGDPLDLRDPDGRFFGELVLALASLEMLVGVTDALGNTLVTPPTTTSQPIPEGQVSELKVVTEIRPPDVQAGMKSTHVIRVDRNSGELLSERWQTGVTKVFGREIGSRGDAFSADVRATGDSLIVDMTGETASKLFPFMINYDLDLVFDHASGTWSALGTHDGYPSYVVTADGVVIYDYQQGSIGELLGCCDVEVGRR